VIRENGFIRSEVDFSIMKSVPLSENVGDSLKDSVPAMSSSGAKVESVHVPE